MDFISLGLIAIGLSMDAFAVAICNGIAIKRVKIGHALAFGCVFGGFQFAMPVAGYYLGSALGSYIESVDHWIAFALLAFIGGKMIFEAFRPKRAAGAESLSVAEGLSAVESPSAVENPSVVENPSGAESLSAIESPSVVESPSGGGAPSVTRLLALGIATSIDALAVGVSIAISGWNIWVSAAVIGATAFALSFAGVLAGKRIGKRFQKNAGLLGGVVLIAIGIKMLVEHLFF